MYTPIDDKTRSLFPDFFHFGSSLDASNRWLKLSEVIPWGRMDELYRKYFSETAGRPAVNGRLICALLVLKRITGLSDEEVVNMFSENPYIQAFCGRKYFDRNPDINPSILSERRKRLGEEFFTFFDTEIARILKEQKYVRFKFHSQRKRKPGFLSFIGKIKRLLHNPLS